MKNRQEFIEEALDHIKDCVGGRARFFEKLAASYPDGKVSRATISIWKRKGYIPPLKATLLASWSNGEYTPEQLCPQLSVE